MDRKTLITILKYVVGLGLGILLLWLAMRGVDFQEVKEGFRQANYFWVAFGLLLALLSHWFRAARWKLLFRAAGHESNTLNLFAAIMVGYMVNQAVPRAGEISRATLGSRTEKIPLAVSFGTLVTDRIFDIIILGLLVLGVLTLEFDQIMRIMDKAVAAGADANAPAEAGGGWLKWILIAIPTLALVIFLVLRKRIVQTALYKKGIGFLFSMWSAVRSIRKMDRPLLFVFYSLGIWVCYILMTYLVFYSMDATSDLSFMFALTAFTMGGIGMVFPSPGGIGSYHFAIIMTFVAYAGSLGLTEETAKTVGTNIAFIIHTSQLIMMIVVGFLCYLFLVPRLRVAGEAEAGADPA